MNYSTYNEVRPDYEKIKSVSSLEGEDLVITSNGHTYSIEQSLGNQVVWKCQYPNFR